MHLEGWQTRPWLGAAKFVCPVPAQLFSSPVAPHSPMAVQFSLGLCWSGAVEFWITDCPHGVKGEEQGVVHPGILEDCKLPHGANWHYCNKSCLSPARANPPPEASLSCSNNMQPVFSCLNMQILLS